MYIKLKNLKEKFLICIAFNFLPKAVLYYRQLITK